MKKILTTVLSLTMIATLSSCSPAENSQADTTTPSEEAQTTNMQNNSNGDLDIIVYEIPKKNTDYIITSVDEINKRLEELGKGYRVEFRIQGDREKIADLAASGEVDIITSTDSADSKQMGESGLLLELSDYLASEKGKPLYESITENMWYSLTMNGKIYGTTGYIYAGTTPPSYYINRELMKKYNLTEENFHCSIAELEEILSKVKKGEGGDFHPLKFSIPHHIWPVLSYMEPISKAVEINIKTGKAELYIDNEDYMSIMRDIYDMNKKGYIFIGDKDGMVIKKENYLVSFSFTAYQLKPHRTEYKDSDIPQIIEDEDSNIPQSTEEELLAVMWDESYGYYSAGTWPATCVCSKSQKQEQALDLISTIYTDKILSDLFVFGVEGADYTRDENGAVIQRFYSPIVTLYFGNSVIASDYSDSPKEFYIEKQKKTQKNPYLDFEADEFLEEAVDNSMNLIYEGLEEGRDFDEVIAEIRTKLNEGGAQQYLDSLNKKLEEYMRGR